MVRAAIRDRWLKEHPGRGLSCSPPSNPPPTRCCNQGFRSSLLPHNPTEGSQDACLQRGCSTVNCSQMSMCMWCKSNHPLDTCGMCSPPYILPQHSSEADSTHRRLLHSRSWGLERREQTLPHCRQVRPHQATWRTWLLPSSSSHSPLLV